MLSNLRTRLQPVPGDRQQCNNVCVEVLLKGGLVDMQGTVFAWFSPAL